MTIEFTPSSENQVDTYLYQMPIKGLLYLDRKAFGDNRGFYAELARIPEVEKVTNQTFSIKQLNLSYSNQNVIRGFHAENWNKLLTVISGTAFCAWADVREASDTFGQVVTMTIGDQPQDLQGSVFVSAGIANSFCAVKGPLNYLYGVDQLYAERDTTYDVALNVFDPDLAVNWPLPKEQLIISDRDRDSISLRQKFPNNFTERT